MCEHVPGTVPQVAVASRGITLHELENEVSGIDLERGPSYKRRPARYFLVQGHVVLVCLVVWRETGEHFKNEHTKGVPIHALVVSLLPDNLACQVSTQTIDWREHTSGAR